MTYDAVIACSIFFSYVHAAPLLHAEYGPSGSAVYLAPAVFDHELEGPIGQGRADWYVAQWLIPHSLNPGSLNYSRGDCVLESAIWNLENPDARLCLGNASDSNGYVVELAQSGVEVPCGDEFDFFISPNDGNYPSVPQNVLPLAEMPFLGGLQSVMFSFDAELVYSQITPRCGPAGSCGPSGQLDYGYAVAALTLDNVAAQQSLFYQIMLYDSRQDTPACGAENDPCVTSRSWFFPTNPFGVSDNIANFGDECLRVDGRTRSYALDVLSPLLSALKDGARYGIKPDPSGWQLSGLYIGLGLQGSTVQTMLVSNISLFAS